MKRDNFLKRLLHVHHKYPGYYRLTPETLKYPEKEMKGIRP